MTTFKKISICISFPVDDLGEAVADQSVVQITRYIRELLRSKGAQEAAEHFNIEMLKSTEILEGHEIWWHPGRFGHKDPKPSEQWAPNWSS